MSVRRNRKRLEAVQKRLSPASVTPPPKLQVVFRSGHATEDGWVDDDPLTLPNGCPARERSLRLLESAAARVDKAGQIENPAQKPSPCQ